MSSPNTTTYTLWRSVLHFNDALRAQEWITERGTSSLVLVWKEDCFYKSLPFSSRCIFLCSLNNILFFSTQWANNYVSSPNTTTYTTPTSGKENLTNIGSNFNNNITASYQQHRSSYSTSSEFLSESSPDDSLGDFEGNTSSSDQKCKDFPLLTLEHFVSLLFLLCLQRAYVRKNKVTTCVSVSVQFYFT